MNLKTLMAAREVYHIALKKAIDESNEELKQLFDTHKVAFNEIAKFYKDTIKYEFLLEAKRRYFPSQYLYTLDEMQQLAQYARDKNFIDEMAFKIYIQYQVTELPSSNVIKYIEIKHGKKIVSNPAHLPRLLLKHGLINKETPNIYGYWQEYEIDYGVWKGQWRFTYEAVKWIVENLLEEK
jgi:hypothetical protein